MTKLKMFVTLSIDVDDMEKSVPGWKDVWGDGIHKSDEIINKEILFTKSLVQNLPGVKVNVIDNSIDINYIK